ncbi:unnamed protein product [Phaeothamnion confervicola]
MASNEGGSSDADLARKLQQEELAASRARPVAYAGFQATGGTSPATYYQNAYQAADFAEAGTYAVHQSYTAVPPPTQVFVGEHERRMMDCFSLGRGIKLLALIDGCFLLIQMLMYGYLSLFFWGPVAGYLAASRFDERWARVYLAYYACRIIGDAILLAGGLWAFFLSLMIDCFIARFVYIFFKLLTRCSPEELLQLRSPGSVWSSANPYFVIF